MTVSPCRVWLPKKISMIHQQGSLGGILQTLCTNLEDRIVCNLLTNQNVHSQGKWYSSTMDNIFFEVKKSVSKMHFPGIWRSKFTDLAKKKNSKKTQSLRKKKQFGNKVLG